MGLELIDIFNIRKIDLNQFPAEHHKFPLGLLSRVIVDSSVHGID